MAIEDTPSSLGIILGVQFIRAMHEKELLTVLGQLAIGFLAPFALLMPMVLAANWLIRRRRRFEQLNVDPFGEMPLRPPGEALRLRIDELSEQLAFQFIGLGVPAFAGAIVVSQAMGRQLFLTWVATFAVCVVWTAIMMPRIWRTARELWDYKLGFTGERVVGEALNQMMADGFRVFHDVPFDGFNLDHVLVGPPGVFVFETKSRRKTVKDDGQKEYRVVFDGTVLRWPDGSVDSYGIDQAIRNAKTLSQYLASAAAERVWVKPVLVLPGWLVIRKATGTVNVLNPKEIRGSFSRVEELSADQIQRIAHQLGEKCRLPIRRAT